MACSVVTATSLRTDSLFPSEAWRRAAATSLGVCKAVGCFPGCSSLLLGQHNLGLTPRCRIRPRTRPHSPFYKSPYAVNPNAYPGAPGILNPNGFNAPGLPQSGTQYKGGGDYFFFNFAAFTPALPPGDRQVYYGSFTRDICDKYLTVFGDFKYARSFFDSSLAAVPFTPDPFHNPGPMHSLVLRASVCQLPIRLIRSLLQTRRFQTSFLTEMVSQSRPVFASAVSTTPAHDTKNSLTGISSSTSGCVAKWAMPAITSRRGTGNWVSGIRETRDRTFR